MNILIIGGTRFVGRHLTTTALGRGHHVTHFNRGKSNPDSFPEVETLHGDRRESLAVLEGRQWDVVIDTCGYIPREVRMAAETLKDSVERYIFISTISVYADMSQPGMTEDSPVSQLEDETVEEVTGETYGGLKVLCERAAEAVMPGRVLTIRPGLIVGPHDPTYRFSYWPLRVADGGEVLAPDDPDYPLQFIDGRDLAEFTIDMAEKRANGIYNTTGQPGQVTMQQLLYVSKAVSESDATFTWLPTDFLLEQGVQPFQELTMWVPGDDYAGFQKVSVDKALAAGLRFRPLESIVEDTIAWERERPADAVRPHGLAREKEAAVLAVWHAR